MSSKFSLCRVARGFPPLPGWLRVLPWPEASELPITGGPRFPPRRVARSFLFADGFGLLLARRLGVALYRVARGFPLAVARGFPSANELKVFPLPGGSGVSPLAGVAPGSPLARGLRITRYRWPEVSPAPGGSEFPLRRRLRASPCPKARSCPLPGGSGFPPYRGSGFPLRRLPSRW